MAQAAGKVWEAVVEAGLAAALMAMDMAVGKPSWVVV